MALHGATGAAVMPKSAHQAPAVRYRFGRPCAVAVGLLGLAGVGLAVVSAWIGLQQGSGISAAAALVLWSLCSAAAWFWWHSAESGMLAWDGQQWLLALDRPRTGEAAPLVQAPGICLDLQSIVGVVVRTPSGTSRWLWLERRADPRAWADLRRALVAHGSPSATDKVRAVASEVAP